MTRNWQSSSYLLSWARRFKMKLSSKSLFLRNSLFLYGCFANSTLEVKRKTGWFFVQYLPRDSTRRPLAAEWHRRQYRRQSRTCGPPCRERSPRTFEHFTQQKHVTWKKRPYFFNEIVTTSLPENEKEKNSKPKKINSWEKCISLYDNTCKYPIVFSDHYVPLYTSARVFKWSIFNHLAWRRLGSIL